jgi:hypothetical protein
LWAIAARPSRPGFSRARAAIQKAVPKRHEQSGQSYRTSFSSEITEDGKTRLIAPIEGMLRRLVKDAVSGGKGDGPLKLFLSVLDRYGLSSETAIKLGDLLAEDQAILARYLPPEQPTSPDTSVSPAPEPKSDEGGDDYGV